MTNLFEVTASNKHGERFRVTLQSVSPDEDAPQDMSVLATLLLDYRHPKDVARDGLYVGARVTIAVDGTFAPFE